MATTLETIFQFNLLATLSGLADGFGPDKLRLSMPFPVSTLTDGSGLNQANKVYKGKLTIPNGSATTLDLSGSLLDPQGNVLSFTRIAGIAIYNANTASGDTLTIGDAASHAWEGWTTNIGSTEDIGPEGVWLKWEPSAAGMPVTNGSQDLLQIAAPGSNDVIAYVMIVGS